MASAPERPLAPLVILLGFWAAMLVVASLAVPDAWEQLGRDTSGADWFARGMGPVFSIFLGVLSLVIGGALLGLTWLALRRSERRTLPWVTGIWATCTFIALCGGLTVVMLFPRAGFALLVAGWLMVADVVRIVVTALVVQLADAEARLSEVDG